MEKLNIKIYTDGACSGNPGPGGWAALLLLKGKEKQKIVIKGGEKYSTNNKMELTAVVEALEFISKNIKGREMHIKVYSDSTYVLNPINNGWLTKWRINGWITTKETEVINKDLWQRFIKARSLCEPNLEFIKVKGHSGNKFNDYVDEIAVKERDKYKALLNTI